MTTSSNQASLQLPSVPPVAPEETVELDLIDEAKERRRIAVDRGLPSKEIRFYDRLIQFLTSRDT